MTRHIVDFGASSRRRRRGQSAFDPLSITPYQWFDASQMGLSNNASVTTLTDYSGNALHGSQSTSNQKPLFKTNIQNGKPAIRYDGSNDNHLDALLTITGAKSEVLAFKNRSLTGLSSGFVVYAFLGAGPLWSELDFNDNVNYLPYTFRDDHFASALLVGIADVIDTNAHVLLRTYNGGTHTAPASYTASLDGAAKTVVNTAVGGSNSPTQLGAIGAYADSGSGISNAAPIDLFERYIFNRVLSAGHQASLIAYLRAKWAI